jgi:hypothetical protein
MCRTTYVLNISTYWVKTESIPVSFEAPATTPKPTVIGNHVNFFKSINHIMFSFDF